MTQFPRVNQGYAVALQATPFGGPVPLIEGLPGSAKTAWHRALAEAADRLFVQIILRQKMPEDIGGVPAPGVITIDGVGYEGVRQLLNEEMLRAAHQRCLILLDEFNQPGDDVMGSAQEWINNPPPASWMGAAQNPVEASTAGRELAPPVINRMCKLKWERVKAERRAGWRNGFRNYPAPYVPLLPTDFLDNLGAAWGEIMCDFEDANLDLFGDDAFPKDINKASDPWPSERSWTHVGILMAACDACGLGNTIKSQLVAGCVGDAAAPVFMRFLTHRSLPDFETLLAMPNTLQLPAGNYPIGRATLAGVVGRVMDECTPVRWEAACDVFEVAFQQQPETAISVQGGLWKAKPKGYMPRSRNGAWKEMQDLVLADKK